MPLRFGEMVLIIRTQDFASRNLDRISANLGKLSKQQELSRRRAMLGVREARKIARLSDIRTDLQQINVLKRRAQLEEQLTRAVSTRSGLRLKDPLTGQFRSAKALQDELKRLRDISADYDKRLLRLASDSSALDSRQRRLATAYRLTARELSLIQSDIVHVDEALQQVKWERIHRFGQTLSRTGRIMQLTGLIATGTFVALGNAAANFGQQTTLAATQARDLGAPIAQVATRSSQLQDFILNQMGKFPASAEDMSNAAYEIFSSLDLADKGRVKFWKGLQILEKTNKVAVAGGIELGDAIKGLVITLNNFDPQLKSVDNTLDTMFDIIRFGNLHVNDFTNMMNRVAPAAKSAGLNLEEIGGSIAQLTRVMAPERVATSFARLVGVFTNRDFVEGWKEVSKARIGEALDVEAPGGGLKNWLEILQDIARVFPELRSGQLTAQEFFKIVTRAGRQARTGRAGEGLQFTEFAQRGLTQLIQNLGQVEELQRLVEANQGEFNNAFQAMRDTPAIQWKIFLNTLKMVAIEIGQDALPALLTLAGFIRRGVQWWRNLDDSTKSLIVRIGVFASVATLLGGIFLSVAGGLISLVGAVALLSGGLGGGTTGLIARMALLFRLLRAISLIGAITLTITLIVNSDQFDRLGDWIREHVPGGNKLVDIMGFSFTDMINKIRGVKEERDGLFNPDAKLFPEGISKETKEAFQSFKKARQQGDLPKMEDIWRRATKQTRDELKKAYGDIGLSLDDLRNKYKDVSDEEERTSQLAQQRAQLMETKVKEAVDGMMRIWGEFEQQNRQAMGNLFGGPTMTGMLGNIFTGLNDTLRQFGVQIPIPFKILRQDLDQQISYFRRFRQATNRLLKRGAPLEFVQEIQRMGPEAGIPIAEGLLQGGKTGFKNLLKEWRTGQNLVRKATQSDFNRQLDDWEKHGKNVVLAMIRGIISQPSQMALRNAFETYVTGTFGNILREEVVKETQDAMAAAGEAIASGAGTGGSRGNRTTGGGRGLTVKELNRMTLDAAQRLNSAQGALRVFSDWMSDPRGLGGTTITDQERAIRKRLATNVRNLTRRTSVTSQMLAQERAHPNARNYTITYGGDTVTIRADGATVESVLRALNKKRFQRQQRNRNKSTG